jgi:hypothetical protein
MTSRVICTQELARKLKYPQVPAPRVDAIQKYRMPVVTWEHGGAEPLAELVAEMVAVPGEEVVRVARPLAAELAQDPAHLGDAALRLPEDDALAVGVHGVLPHGAAEHAAAGLAEPERPLLLAIDLRAGSRDLGI